VDTATVPLSPSQLVQEVLWKMLSERRASTP
jgi:hypothetical protein